MTPRASSKRRNAVLGTCVVIGLIVVALAVPTYQRAVVRSKENLLENNLHALRQTIEQYTSDNKKPPATLRDLVSKGYLRAVPTDPITGNDQWTIVTKNGIVDVRSTSDRESLKGNPYSAW